MKIIKIEVDRLPASCLRNCDYLFKECMFLERYEKQPFYRCSLTNKAATGTKRNRFCPLAERPQGEWIRTGSLGNGNAQYMCSNCHHGDEQAESQEVPYCWHCGAKMMKGGAGNDI